MDKDLKLYYSISEVAQMFDVNESLLRFWEKEFPQLSPKKGSRGVRQYRKEDIETVKLIYHLVKERGMTLPGARQRMKDNKENTLRNFEIVDRLKAIREELLSMKRALDGFTYEQVEELKKRYSGNRRMNRITLYRVRKMDKVSNPRLQKVKSLSTRS